MDYRKLIKFGDNSFVISLPRDWLKKNHLEKGDTIYLNENGNNELLIIPNLKQQEPEEKQITIQIDGKSLRRIKRELISAYLNDYNIVTLIGKEIETQGKDIRDIIQNLMALEITEQTKDKIVTQDFLDFRHISLHDLIRKMDIITRAMLTDLSLCLEKDIVANIEQREQDVNRMSYVILRVVRRGLIDPEYAKNLHLTAIMLFESWNIGSQLELIADQALEIASASPKNLSTQQKNTLKKILNKLETMYLNVMKAYHTRDLDLANSVTSLKNDLIQVCKTIDSSSYPKQAASTTIDGFLERLIVLAKEINKIARRVYS